LGERQDNPSFMNFWMQEKRIFSRSLEDFPIIIESSFYIFLGQHISGARFVPAKQNQPVAVVWNIDKCVFCAGLKQDKSIVVNKETMDWENTKMTWGSVVCGIMESAMQAIVDYVSLPYSIKVEETKCIMKGGSA